jgi:hypothetical protein
MNRFNALALAATMVMVVLPAMVSPVTAIVTQSWISGMPGPDHRFEGVCGVATDPAGDVYIVGYSFDHSADIITLKYNPAGVMSWYSVFNSQGDNNDDPEAMTADSAGNVYVTGRSYIPGHSSDVVTVKYNTWGQQQWTAYYNGPNNVPDVGMDLAVDSQGNVFVTGYTGTNYPDYLTIKYSPDGVQQWVATYNGGVNGYDKATDIALDEQGNVYVTGISGFPAGPIIDFDCATVKYNSAGELQWVGRINGPPSD